MSTLEARVTQLEKNVGNHATDLAELKTFMVGWFEAIDQRFEAIDQRFEAIDRRFEAIDQRFDAIDKRFETLDQRFIWLVGMQFATLLALVATMGGIIAKLL